MYKNVLPRRSLLELPRSLAWLLMSAVLFLGWVQGPNLAGSVLISEFLANNFRTLADEDGSYEDWIELYNSGAAAVSLEGYYLTDSKTNLKKWRFPAVSLPPNGYRVVFASGKDRAPAIGNLHTSFKLSSKSGYLALVASNGVTVVSDYSYPAQIANVSYGFPVQDTVLNLVSNSSPARVLVPSDDRDGKLWTAIAFDDSVWTPSSNSLGFETDPITGFNPSTLADSVKDFSGNQGQGNWSYGYWDRGNDSDGVFAPAEFVPFPRATGALSPQNFFTNNVWRWFPSSAASTEINRLGGAGTGDNGIAGGLNHWAVRRYVSKSNSTIRISGMIGDRSLCSDLTTGDGVIARIYVDGVQVFEKAIQGTSTGYYTTTTVNKDSTIDFVIDPGTARNSQCDSAVFTGLISTHSPVLQLVGDSAADWSVTGDQGEKNWLYGYYDKGNDRVANYQTNDFTLFPDPFWQGTQWGWPDGNPPYDNIEQFTMRPNGPASLGGEHWPVRRWLSKVKGTVLLDWHVDKVSLGGNGVTARVYHKGTLKDTLSLAGDNAGGTNRTVSMNGVEIGDPIDFVVDPAGPSAAVDDAFDQIRIDARLLGLASLSPIVIADIKGQMQGVNSSVYVRIPFTVTQPELIDTLAARMRYDSGFIAYLNGVEVLRRNAPVDAAWNAASTLERLDGDASSFESFDLSANKSILISGKNVLAIHGLNSSATDSDFALQAQITARYVSLDSTAIRYFATPTPGGPNGTGNTNLGPLILDVQHQPNTPKPGQDLVVTAQVEPSFNSVSNVLLVYRVMYGAEVTVPMADDGVHGDGAAGDGLFGATIPSAAYKAGNMVRYFVKALDVSTNLSRNPVFVKGKPGPEYWGTMVEDASMTNPLPVLYWFAPSAGAADSGGISSFFYNGQFFDNVNFGIHGQSSSGFAKHSWNINMNVGYKLTWQQGQPDINDINLLTTYPDKAHMRNMLTYGSYRDAGTAYHFVVPVRVQLNGQFWGDAHFVENGDSDYLKRVGLDPNGALYKMYNTFDAPDGEKKSRKFENNADLTAFFNGMGQSGPALQAYMYDNVNIPEVVNYLATMTLTANTDCCHKNYYFYRDSEGTGEWQMLPWDQDLSFGRVWSGGPSYWDDTMYTNTDLRVGGNNRVPAAIFNNPVFDQMYVRRLRTLMEELLQAPGTPTHLLKYERFIDEWIPKIAPDAALDLAKWGTFSGDASSGTEHDQKNKQTLTEAANIIKYEYLPGRRNWLFAQSQIPKSQPAIPSLLIGQIEFNPSSGNQDQEYFTIINTNKVFIDISHWRITGAVEMQFQGGTIIPTNGVLYVSPNVNAFRARSSGPRGGQRLFVQGNYKGHLSARGESIQLVDTTGTVITATNYVGQPSAPQNSLRITEIMYHPSPAVVGGPFATEDYEYLELKNIGTSALDLTGVRFVNGVAFNFTGSAVTSLAAGQTVLVVKNAAAFAARYGAGKPIAGQYLGTLSDSGETLRLEDASGETILDFAYNNSWYAVTEGAGFSLVIIDPTASWDTWGLKESWRPSGVLNGTPGGSDPGPLVFVPVEISEVLANSGGKATDAIELHNPSSVSAAIGNWFLTDDFNTPKKYKIKEGTTLAAGGYLVIPESEFAASLTTGFALSYNGDEVYLFSANAAGDLTGYVNGFQFGASAEGATLGLHTNSVGHVDVVTLETGTLGSANSGPRVGPVVIAEVMYHPIDQVSGAQASLLEYVELRNVSGAAVPLFDPIRPTNTWRMKGGVGFEFPTNTTLAPNSSVVLVNFNPLTHPDSAAAFRTVYGTPADVKLFGPYSGNLGNGADGLTLLQPEEPDLNSVTAEVVVDHVSYSDAAPWPSLADGFGPALTRSPLSSYGNDPASWIAAKPSPGFLEIASIAPVLTLEPVSSVPTSGSSLDLKVAAVGDKLAYQWVHDGEAIVGATSPSFSIANLQILDWGSYQSVVMNPSGAVISSNGVVVVQRTAVITKQPQPKNVLSGTNVTFTVTAIGTGKVRFQWLYNGLEVVGATNVSLALKGVTTANEGAYSVRVIDDVGTTLSTPASLTLFDRQQIIQAPQPVAVLAGEDATFSVLVSGRGPFNFKWQRSSIAKTNFFQAGNLSTFTVKAVTPALAGNYNVVVTNLAGVSVTAPLVALSILADADGDRMADVWELANGLSITDATDAARDSDGDGVSNLDEYRADTDPKDPKSYLKIDTFQSAQGVTELEFFAKSNRTYTVEFHEAVGQGLWQTLTNVMVSTNSRVEHVVDPFPVAANRIYRLATPALVDRPIPTPAILETPVSIRVAKGSPVSLSVYGVGKGTLRYQWLKEGQPIPGAVNATLSFGSVQPADQGVYTVTLTDDAGKVTSQPATIVVLEEPTLLQLPKGVTVNLGGSAQFSVQATGNLPLQYQWLHNGAPIPGANTATLKLTGVTLDHAGSYTVLVRHNTSNGPVAVETDPVDLVVNP